VEILTTRIIDTLKQDLPDMLKVFSDYYSAEDVALYGEEIPLPAPPSDNCYFYGSAMAVISDYPAIEVIPLGYEVKDNGSVNRSGFLYELHEFLVVCRFRYSRSEEPERITKGSFRFTRAVEKVLKNNPGLAIPSTAEDPIGHSVEITDVNFYNNVPIKSMFFKKSDLRVVYKTLNLMDNRLGHGL